MSLTTLANFAALLLLSQQPAALTVSADGTGTHKTVQAAIDAAPEGTPTVILIKPGIYKERLVIPKSKAHLTLRGDPAAPEKTKLTFDLHARSILPPATQPVGTTGSTSTLISGDDFTAEGLTFENPSGEIAQAVAVKITSDRVVFRNCRFLGGQDTLYPDGGRALFDRCYIEGRADFIFGRMTAVFDHCEVHSKNGGFVTAPSTLPDRPIGFVFLDCTLTGEGPDQAYLGRPWRDYGACAYIRCVLGVHIRPEGWHNWRPEREKTARFSEYHNTGPGADPTHRVPWSHQLTDEEAAKYSRAAVLAGPDGWTP